MKNIFRKNIKLFIGIFIGIICSGITVYAANYLAKDIAFVPSNNNWKVSNVEEAINDLYNNQNNKNDYSALIGVKWNFDYTGGEQTLKIPVKATYKIETWGAQGGNATSDKKGGYGGYSVGEIVLLAGETLYINVGGQGSVISGSGYMKTEGGYNGGGDGQTLGIDQNEGSNRSVSGGGGATHIAKVSGLLSTLENKISDIIIVSGGGSGNWKTTDEYWRTDYVGSGGGFIGTQGKSSVEGVTYYADGGNQKSHGELGVGLGTFGNAAVYENKGHGGAGGGFYGGNSTYYTSGGGSGYIGNSLLKNKSMYCYNCTESNEESIKTISTTKVSSSPVSNYAKEGNGYARITLVAVD